MGGIDTRSLLVGLVVGLVVGVLVASFAWGRDGTGLTGGATILPADLAGGGTGPLPDQGGELGEMDGIVRDADGLPVANASVELYPTGRQVTTDENGRFSFGAGRDGLHCAFLLRDGAPVDYGCVTLGGAPGSATIDLRMPSDE
jgi:hypothetical protein